MTIDKCCSQRTRTRLVGCPFTLSLNGSVSHKTHWLRCHEYLGVTLSNRIRSTDGTSHKTLSQESATTLYIPGSWHFIVPPANNTSVCGNPELRSKQKNELAETCAKIGFDLTWFTHTTLLKSDLTWFTPTVRTVCHSSSILVDQSQ